MRLIFTTLVLISATTFAQTKPVAYRSHSGNIRFIAESVTADNLGWGGTNLTPGTLVYDSTLFLKFFPPAVDSLTNFPYCNNPSIPADSLAKHFPFYTGVMEEVPLKDTVNLKEVDTIGKSRTELQERNNPEKKNALPFIEPGSSDDVSGWNPGYGTILLFGLFMLITGAFIWVTNRDKIQPSA
jgi:hypothetical protein